MTKEDLIEQIGWYDNEQASRCVEYINEFFESNVCIPKGENRHPYADVLHEWVEGVSCEYRSPNDPVGLDGWYDMKFPSHEYRIKPSEPVYEWQWYGVDSGKAYLTDFYTDNEVNPEKWTKIEETKRERKQ